jgi:hypothetical protein
VADKAAWRDPPALDQLEGDAEAAGPLAPRRHDRELPLHEQVELDRDGPAPREADLDQPAALAQQAKPGPDHLGVARALDDDVDTQAIAATRDCDAFRRVVERRRPRDPEADRQLEAGDVSSEAGTVTLASLAV